MENIKMMSRTIDDFRNFFKPDKRKAPFDVHDALEKVISLLSAQFEANEIDCVVTRGKSTLSRNATIFGFLNELEHVVLNILSNAKDAVLEQRESATGSIGRGKIDIHVDVSENRVRIEFRDNGSDIAEGVRGHVFEPYVSSKGSMHGTGMGLYMSKVMIEDHMDGRLYLKSDGEKVFCIEMPRLVG